ncbi:MAG: S1 RNA-binding domain-containing protein, partial [Thermoanaerobaculia bacterium]
MASNDDPKKRQAPSRQTDASLEGLGMAELLNLYDKSTLAEGEIVTGRVIKVMPTDIVVDIGYKSEGLLPKSEVTTYDGEVRVKAGDEIEVFVERLEDPSGYVMLSREKAARMRIWDDIEAAYKADQPIDGRVIDRVKGGLSVDVGGVKAFLPGSLIDTKPIKNLDSLRGHDFKFKVVSFDKKRSNVVLSRRAIVEVEHEKEKAETFGRLEEGKL